jgi:phosphatidylinositol-3-phosphatase
MKKLTLPLLAFSMLIGSYGLQAQLVPVKPAHVIIVMEENYAYEEIIGSTLAPTFTWLSKTQYTANFTQDYAITHPSEPNYLELFSGSDQGDCCNDIDGPIGSPLNDCNLGSSLIQDGYTFIGYSEDQPSVGWISSDEGNYYTKHCPWINWIGYNTNPDTIPEASDVPYSDANGYTGSDIFPDSNNYASLPTVTWVIPNSVDDMHDGSEGTAIPNGDNWFHTNMMPLVRWASNPANNAVVITTWDEDDDGANGTQYNNNIPLLVSSGLVNGGNYTTTLNHYDLLKTIEDMYGLSECGSSDSSTGAIDLPKAIWKVSGINSIIGITNQVNIWPVPAKNELNVNITSDAENKATIGFYDITGRMIKEFSTQLKPGENLITMNIEGFSDGVYFLTITGDNINLRNKVVVGN